MYSDECWGGRLLCAPKVSPRKESSNVILGLGVNDILFRSAFVPTTEGACSRDLITGNLRYKRYKGYEEHYYNKSVSFGSVLTTWLGFASVIF